MSNQIPSSPSTPRPNTSLSLGATGSSSYKPKVYRTKGARLACLVNASVTACPDNTIYAFGGFDQFTDEVYNHVLRLDLQSFTWSLVDNFGEIPSVRMGHTTTYWKDNKLVVFGGENEHRAYLSDVYIFDIATATWSQPVVSGTLPRGRSRHSATLYDEKLFVLGGTCGPHEYLQDVMFLDLETMTWSRPWNFVCRFDHTSWVHKNRLYVFGGLTEDMDRPGELCWLDLGESPAWKSLPRTATGSKGTQTLITTTSASAYAQSINPSRHTSGTRASPSNLNIAPAPGTINAVKFIKGAHNPNEAVGNHFHHFGGATLLDFVTQANTIRDHDTSLSALDLDTLSWRTLANGAEIFVSANYRWHYLAVSPDQTTAFLLGCPADAGESEYLSDVLPIDLTRYGVVPEKKENEIGSLGIDLSNMFDDPSTSDFTVTAIDDTGYDDDDASVSPISRTNSGSSSSNITSPATASSPPIHVHKLILRARWAHFNRLYNARMAEFHSNKLYIPEPFSVVKAFLFYLYTDSIAPSVYCPNLTTVAGLLVLSNIYNLPQLRVLCLSRIGKEMNVESVAAIWERAGVAGEEALRAKAAKYCMVHWGRVIRTDGFRRLPKKNILELCDETDLEARILSEEELETVGGLTDVRIINPGRGTRRHNRAMSVDNPLYIGDDVDDGADDDDAEEGMDVN